MTSKVSPKEVLFEGTPVVFTPLEPGGKHPELVVVDLRDLTEASKRHRQELLAQQEKTEKLVLEGVREMIGEERFPVAGKYNESNAITFGWNECRADLLSKLSEMEEKK